MHDTDELRVKATVASALKDSGLSVEKILNLTDSIVGEVFNSENVWAALELASRKSTDSAMVEHLMYRRGVIIDSMRSLVSRLNYPIIKEILAEDIQTQVESLQVELGTLDEWVRTH